MYLLLGAEFVAWVQILIYVGAIVILFLFGLMLTKAPIGRDSLDNQQRWLGALVGVGVFAGLVFLIGGVPWDAAAKRVAQVHADVVGRRSSATTCCRSRRSRSCCWRRWSARSCWRARTTPMIRLPLVLFFSAVLFSAASTVCWRAATRSWC